MVLCTSCSFLDFDETNSLQTLNNIYEYYNTAERMLVNVYSYIPQDYGVINGAMRDCATDDAQFGNQAANVQVFNNGNWSDVRTVDTAWELYEGIRAANAFIAQIKEVDFSRFEHDPSYENEMKKLACFEYEARVLRSYYFFELAKRYGDIAMPLSVLTPEQANRISKSSFADVIAFIVKECDECAVKLPESWMTMPGAQLGRVTKGFAMSLKSKVLLYAASPLHNKTNDLELWKKSAAAAYDVIQSGLYSLDPSGTSQNPLSKEIILAKMNNADSKFELYNFPLRFTCGNRPSNSLANSTFPSQNLVDAFQTQGGYSVTLTESGWECDDPFFNPRAPYSNRDKRFYRTILANGMEFKGDAIEVFEGGKDAFEVNQGGSATGYYLMKGISPTTNFQPDKIVMNKHHWVICRYAEIYLSFAESMIEAYGDPDETAGFGLSARAALNAVRANASMPDVMVNGKEDFIEALRNEWRVEFAFEDHRFWDIRRWKIAESLPREIYGVSIMKERNTYKYSRFTYDVRRWKDCMYLYPIPKNEIFKNPNLNPQNIGW